MLTTSYGKYPCPSVSSFEKTGSKTKFADKNLINKQVTPVSQTDKNEVIKLYISLTPLRVRCVCTPGKGNHPSYKLKPQGLLSPSNLWTYQDNHVPPCQQILRSRFLPPGARCIFQADARPLRGVIFPMRLANPRIEKGGFCGKPYQIHPDSFTKSATLFFFCWGGASFGGKKSE